MSYIELVEQKYGGKERRTDTVRFAGDLAKELGGEHIVEAEGVGQRIKVGDVMLHLYCRFGDKGRVTVSINAADIDARDINSHNPEQKTQCATVNPDGRTIALIAKDIQRRVIDASQSALAKQREYVGAVNKTRAAHNVELAKLRKLLPNMKVTVNREGESASLYNSGGGHYVTARLDYGGTVTLERLGSLTVEQFAKILAVLDSKD